MVAVDSIVSSQTLFLPFCDRSHPANDWTTRADGNGFRNGSDGKAATVLFVELTIVLGDEKVGISTDRTSARYPALYNTFFSVKQYASDLQRDLSR